MSVMRKIIRAVLLATTGTLFIVSLLFAAAWSRSEKGELLAPVLHLLVFLNFLFAAWFLHPYQKWLWNKPGGCAKTVLALLILCVASSWVLGAIEVTWAPVELFFAFGWATMLFALLIGLWNLPRVRAFNA